MQSLALFAIHKLRIYLNNCWNLWCIMNIDLSINIETTYVYVIYSVYKILYVIKYYFWCIYISQSHHIVDPLHLSFPLPIPKIIPHLQNVLHLCSYMQYWLKSQFLKSIKIINSVCVAANRSSDSKCSLIFIYTNYDILIL